MLRRCTALMVVGFASGLALVACSGGEVADEESSPSTNRVPTATVSVDTTTEDSLPATTTNTTAATTACTTTAPSEAVSDWTSFGFDNANSRHNRAETTLGPTNVACLEVAWIIEGLGGVTGTPVVIDGVVYFGDWNGSLHAVDAKTGTAVWEAQIDKNPVFAATVLVTESVIFIPDLDGHLHAHDRVTGSSLWSTEVDSQPAAAIFSAPVLVDDMVIIVAVAGNDSSDASLRGSVVALDAESGTELWRFSTTDEQSLVRTGVWTSGAVDRDLGLIFFGTGNSLGLPVGTLAKALVAIDYATGDLVWSNVINPVLTSEADVAASPTLFTANGQRVVGVGGKNGLFKVVDRSTGVEVWAVELSETTVSFGAGVYSTAALGDDVIYVNSRSSSESGSSTFALDVNDGSTLWVRPIDAPVFGSMTLANGIVYHGTIGGSIYALDAIDGAILWTGELPGTFGDGVSVADGMLYVGYGFSSEFLPIEEGGIVAYSLPGQ